MRLPPCLGPLDAVTEDGKGVNVMTVVLVLACFLVFIVVDYFLNRRKAIQTVSGEATQAAAAAWGADYVDGFLVPRSISYHSGHSWLVRERKNVVRVGADEFAAALAGRIEKIELPKAGQWIRQGQKAFAFIRDGQKTEMVSPTEGEVMEVNAEVVSNPALMRHDPYGRGWLMSVHVPDDFARLLFGFADQLVNGALNLILGARFHWFSPAKCRAILCPASKSPC